jgi:hypothetical protein
MSGTATEVSLKVSTFEDRYGAQRLVERLNTRVVRITKKLFCFSIEAARCTVAREVIWIAASLG